MQLGIILRLLTVLAAFVLGRIAFDNPVFDEMLITLPAELVSYLFLFYWLHCYIREQIPKAGRYQLVKSACGSLLLLLLNLSGDVASRRCSPGYPVILRISRRWDTLCCFSLLFHPMYSIGR